MIAEIVVNVPRVSGTFSYRVSHSIENQIVPGCLVVVPFGAQAVQGVVLTVREETAVLDDPAKIGGRDLREVSDLVDPLPVLTPYQIELARWMSAELLSPLAACVELMLPPGLNQQADTIYHLNEPLPPEAQLSPTARRLAQLLRQRGDLRGRQLDAALPRQNWRAAAQAMQRRGWLAARSVLPPPSVRPRLVRTVQLACPPQEIADRLAGLSRRNSAAFQRRAAVMDFLLREPAAVDAAWVYAQSGAKLSDLHRLADAGLVILSENEAWRDPLERLKPAVSQPLDLTPHQQRAWQQLSAGLAAAFNAAPPPPFVLHGVTGSGKTELYLRAVQQTLQANRQALVLVPEISLTPQMVRIFASRFPGQVGLVHSRLSPGERFDTWRRARDGRLKVIIGARSALFSPLPALGLVVVDEFHEPSYYQSDLFPSYHAVEAALTLARLAGGVAVLGSATPDVALFYRAQRQGWSILSLPERVASPLLPAGGGSPTAPPPLPPVEVIDMRAELKDGNRSIFSRALQAALREVVEKGQQAILFLNRRGTATYVFCRACGYRLDCPRCEIPLTYHSSAQGLVCHRCNYRRLLPPKCPQCGSAALRQLGAGTETVESEVKKVLPEARILRWDAESTRQKGAHELILTHFANHQADVLVGTQMLAKGLDLPLVTLVGAVLAESNLALPDYRAAERTFQLLTQVAGRAGRSELGGRVIFQTFQPGQYAIRHAARHDFWGFYQQELKERQRLGYPPFYRLVRLEYRHADGGQAAAAAHELAAQVRAWIEQSGRASGELIGPAPCFITRLEGLTRWQLVIRTHDPAGLLRGKPLEGWRVQIDPPDLL